MRKGLIITGLVILTVQSPQRVEAGAFATEVTQLLNHAQLIMQYIRQCTQLANELNMYANMVRNTNGLSAQTFGSVMNDLNALAGIVQGGHSRIRWGISTSFFVRRIRVTVTTREPITPNTGTGPKPLLIRPLEHCVPPECRGNNFRMNSPC